MKQEYTLDIGTDLTITLPVPSNYHSQKYVVKGIGTFEINCNKNDRYYIPKSCCAMCTTVLPKRSKVINWILKLFRITVEPIWKVDVIRKGGDARQTQIEAKA